MKRSILSFCAAILLALVNPSFSQNLDEYDWSEAKYLAQDKKYSKNDQVYLKRTHKIEYNFDDKSSTFSMVSMNHFVVQVNTEKGIKLNKELEPPIETETKKVLEFKIRIIQPDGTFYEFKKSDLKEKKESQREKLKFDDEDEEEEEEEEETSEDDEEDETYTYYDLSELKIGSQFEFYSIVKIENPSMSGSMMKYQSRIPIQKFFYEVNANKEFSFQFKPYNGAPKAVKDSTNKVRVVYQLQDEMIDAFPKEKFSNYGANVRGFIHKLDGYELGKKRGIYNIEDMTRNLYKFVYTLQKKEMSVAKKMIKQLKLKSYKTDKEKIIALENHIKTTYAILDVGSLNFLFSIENIAKYNALTSENAAKLMANIFNMLEIEHDLVLACNRFEYRYDKEFESNFFMDRFMFYFPKEKKFLDPYSKSLRFGFISNGFSHNNALFISSLTIGGVTSGVGKIKFIDALDKDDSVDNIEVKVVIAAETKKANVEMTRTMTGYFSCDWQAYFDPLDAEQRVDYDKALFKFMDEKMEATKTEYLNTESKVIGVKPFIVKGKGESTELVVQRGDTLVFKVGKLIGPQTDLYKATEPRSLPIERGNANTYTRTLEIQLPEGYTIRNITSLNKMFEVKNENGQVAAIFKSTHELQGNTLIINIDEWYQDIILPASKYTDFKNVINASADFSKLELKMLK